MGGVRTNLPRGETYPPLIPEVKFSLDIFHAYAGYFTLWNGLEQRFPA